MSIVAVLTEVDKARSCEMVTVLCSRLCSLHRL